MSEGRADFPCPSCDSTDVFRADGTDGTYECRRCGQRTHERIEENREALEALADTDLPVADVAQTLVGDSE